MTYIRAPKRACPRDLGFWYCQECIEKHEEGQSCLDFPIPLYGCGSHFGDKVCGKTHLGYEWCENCQASNRTKPHPHIGEFEIVGQIENTMENETDESRGPPRTIYLQCYDRCDGRLLDFSKGGITWCVDRINDDDAVYILAPVQPPRTQLGD